MSERIERRRDRLEPPASEDDVDVRGFRLMRYFTLTSLVAFAAVVLALAFLQWREGVFFADVQRDQSSFFSRAQLDLARKQEESARRNLVAVYEAAHVNLTRVFADVLWDSDFAPFVARVQSLPIDRCRALPASAAAGTAQSEARNACFAELGERIRALPGFAALDERAYALLRSSSVFKIKVFDLRGVTVYSSDHSQIGGDASDNQGWRSAVAGRAASELTHRDRFSTFEGVVENRDLLSSYVPVRAPGSNAIVGVFEIYSDATDLLAQLEGAAAEAGSLAAANRERLQRTAAQNQLAVDSSSERLMLIVGGLLALFYVALLLLVRNGQRIIDRQARAQEASTRREERWHREKMAALAAMAANVSHEVGNPLATISMLAQEIALQQAKNGCAGCQPARIIEEARRIGNMTRQIADFAAARRETLERVDINQMVKAVLDFLCFDRRFGSMQIDFRPDNDLPSHPVVPDKLNEVLMNLLQGCAECDAGLGGPRGRIRIETHARAGGVVIRVGCECAGGEGVCAGRDPFGDSRFEAMRRRIGSMGGELTRSPGTVEIVLPADETAAASA